jgi:hypothetical protein
LSARDRCGTDVVAKCEYAQLDRSVSESVVGVYLHRQKITRGENDEVVGCVGHADAADCRCRKATVVRCADFSVRGPVTSVDKDCMSLPQWLKRATSCAEHARIVWSTKSVISIEPSTSPAS